VSFNIYLLRPIAGGTMSATGKVVNASRNLWVAESTLVDGDGRTLGRGSGSFMRSRSALVDAMGYAEAR
jgi:acyl-coenzyme A thioesterase PaaI-like protein